MRDTQRQRVYDWEADLGLDKTLMTLKEVEAFANEVTHDYGKRPITVGDGRRRQRGNGGWGHINLPKWTRYRGYVLHEIAHALHTTDHGPVYARFLAELLNRYAGVPMSLLRQKATEHHVRWARSGAGHPKPLTREERRLKDEVKRTRGAYDEALVALTAYRERRKKVN